MADACMPERFYELAHPLLPAEQEPGPDGGRPRIRHRIVLKVIWFVLVTGCRWKDVPQEIGCCGETARTRMQAWERAGIWDQLHRLLLTMLNHEKQLHLETAIVDTTQVRAFGGGEQTGPSPVDRRKPGTKFTLLVDRLGVPLVIRAVPANRSDHCEILPAVVSFPQVGGRPGRPRTHPQKLYADAGFDSEATRTLLRWLGIEPYIRPRNAAHGSHLGRIRWVVERTFGWFMGCRRLVRDYELLPETSETFIYLAMIRIMLKRLA